MNSGTPALNVPYLQTTGTLTLVGGGVQSPTRLDLQGGLLTGSGTIAADILNNGTINPSLGANGLNINGNVSLLSGSQLIFQIGGLAQGTQYATISINGSMVAAGNLVVMFVNGFENSVANSNTFTLISTSGGLSGMFANVMSGGRVTLTGSVGSFLVTYVGGTLVLSDYRLGLAGDPAWRRRSLEQRHEVVDQSARAEQRQRRTELRCGLQRGHHHARHRSRRGD